METAGENEAIEGKQLPEEPQVRPQQESASQETPQESKTRTRKSGKKEPHKPNKRRRTI